MSAVVRVVIVACAACLVGLVYAADDAEALIRRKLAERAVVELSETPLAEALAKLKSQYKLTLVIDKRAIEDEGLELTTPITLSVRDVSLGSALRLMLQPLGLATVIQHEALVVTTQLKAADLLERRVYGILDLLPDRDEQNAQAADQLRELVRATVAPATWVDTGGKGSIRALHGMLVVSQSQGVHREVESLLASLRAIRKQGEGPVAQASGLSKSLAKKVTIDWKDQPLAEALAALGKQQQVQIALDVPSLEDAGIRGNQPVTAQLQEMSLGSALSHVLAPLSLAFVEQDEFLVIVTEGQAATRHERRLFDVRDLSREPGEVLDVIQATVAPESWERTGGQGAAREYAGHLIVWQTQDRARQIAALLADMRAVRRGQAEGAVALNQAAGDKPAGDKAAGDKPKSEKPAEKPPAEKAEAPSPEAVAAYNRGTQLVADLEYKKAVEVFSEAIKLSPKYVRAWRSRGHANYAIQQYQASVSDYTMATQLDPKNADAYFERGRAYKALDMKERSDEDRKKAIELDPSLKDYDYE